MAGVDAQFGPHRFGAGDGGGSAEFRAARFDVADLRGARFTDCDLTGVTIRDGWLVDVSISGYLSNVTVNGVDVTGFVSAELDRRHPERVQFRAGQDADDFRAMWDTIERLWADATEQAGRLAPRGGADRAGQRGGGRSHRRCAIWCSSPRRGVACPCVWLSLSLSLSCVCVCALTHTHVSFSPSPPAARPPRPPRPPRPAARCWTSRCPTTRSACRRAAYPAAEAAALGIDLTPRGAPDPWPRARASLSLRETDRRGRAARLRRDPGPPARTMPPPDPPRPRPALTDADLGRGCLRSPAPGYPEEERPVAECLAVVMDEEIEHYRFAAREPGGAGIPIGVRGGAGEFKPAAAPDRTARQLGRWKEQRGGRDPRPVRGGIALRRPGPPAPCRAAGEGGGGWSPHRADRPGRPFRGP